ncbi:MAG TPA: hypothetical protein VK076_09020 [Candidatus Sphingobacterium stercoripullorum]|nr:hypothetical protein [Candidatus Sphingobacterium stercoripullorum]
MRPILNNKHLFISALKLIILSFNTLIANAQIINKGQSNYRVDWQVLETKNHRLIFPKDFQKSAEIIAHNIDEISSLLAKDYQLKIQKTPIVFENNHLLPNGFMQLAPRKSEVYSTPSFQPSNQKWLNQLLVHELRHTAQMDKLTGSFKAPFFEQLGLAIFSLSLPSWYFEGDAVEAETRYSSGGRGRMPSWSMPLFATLGSKKKLSFQQALLGSYKRNLPSFYISGYHMNSYLSAEFGYDIKNLVLQEMKTNILRPYNFNKSLKKHSGLSAKELFKYTTDALIKEHDLASDQKQDSHRFFEGTSKFPESYISPQFGPNNREIYAILETPTKTNRIVKIKDNKIHELLPTGIQSIPYFHLNGDKIVWTERRRSPRYSKHTYHSLQVYHIAQEKLKTIKNNTRYFQPIVHSKSNTIAAIKPMDNQSVVHLLNLDNGDIIDSISAPRGIDLYDPSFNPQGDKIISVAIGNKGTAIWELDLNTKKWTTLINWSSYTLENPLYYKDGILFKSHYHKKDELYFLNANQKIIQLTSSSYGAFNPSIYQDSVVFNHYIEKGLQVSKMALDDLLTYPSEDLPLTIENTYKTPLDSLNKKQTGSYTVKKYNSFKNLFNFHSLSLSSNNFENIDNFKPGIFWYANDLLNQSQLKMGVEWDQEVRKTNYSTELIYQKYLPVIQLSYKNLGRKQGVQVENHRDSIIPLHWREHVSTAQISLPFNTYKRNSSYSYGLSVATSYTQRYEVSQKNLKNFNSKLILPMHYQVYFQKNALRAPLDLQPKWGQHISITYRHFPFTDQLEGSIWSVRTNFFFPGLTSNHGIQVRYSWQETNGNYLLTNDIPLAYGYSLLTPEIVSNTLLTSYRLPLAYPDFAIGNLAYIKRIHGQLFSDFQNVKSKQLSPASYGLGITFDFHAFNYPAPLFSFGAKIGYLTDSKQNNKFHPTFSLSYSY